MSSFIILLGLLIAVSKSNNLICNHQNECSNNEYWCNSGDSCSIFCSAINSCFNSTFHCSDAPQSHFSKYCNITCNSANGAACNHVRLDATISFTEIHILGSDQQFYKSYLDCGTSSQCNLYCGHDYNHHRMCKNSTINATNAQNLSISAFGYEVLRYSKVHCPSYGECSINVQGHTQNLMPNMEIFINNQYTTNLSINCSAEQTSWCYGGAGYEPILYCYDSRYSCKYVTTDGINWNCQNLSSPCSINSNPTLAPTVAPIVVISTTTFINPQLSWTFVDIQYVMISVVMIIILLSMIILTKYKLSHEKEDSEKWVSWIALAKMTSFCISYVSWIAVICLQIEDKINGATFCRIIMYLFFIIGWMSLYSSMTHRLYHTFKDSAYKMSKSHIIFHLIVLFCIPIWYSLVIVAYDKDGDNFKIYLISSLIGTILIFIGLLSLIIGFNHKLFKVIVVSNSYNGDNNILLNVITKQTLLGSIMILSMIIFVFIVLILSLLQSDERSTGWIIYEWILALLVIINCLCIFLGFKINDSMYQKILNLCHSKIISFYKLLSMLKNPKDESLMESSNSIMTNISADINFEDELFVHT